MQANGSFTTIDGMSYYRISDSQTLPPFFIQVPSSSNIWIFMSSKGGITAGRQNAGGNIFPYETDDRLHQAYDTGSRTLVKCDGKLWQPFEANGTNKYAITQNIYKSYYGNSVMMEEVNHDLNLTFSYKYECSEAYGIVKTSKFTNLGNTDREIEVLDGLMNILPYGVNENLQSTSSNLVDAYKAAELCDNSLAVYSLTTVINDTPNPIEVMRANIAYTTLPDAQVYLNPDIVEAFKQGCVAGTEKESYGKKSAYFVTFAKTLKDIFSYSVVLDNGYDHSKLAEVTNFIKQGDFSPIFADIKAGTDTLIEIVKNADGIQQSGDPTACAHHYLNTLYNVMRGGTFEKIYDFDYDDFLKFVTTRNTAALKNTTLLQEIKDCATVHQLKEVAKADDTLYRLALEYMPLSFSRRHGDPSRPWNRFNIALKDENGEKISNYEGNWRDIYQNWEALGLSYPCYYENMVSKFVNASTADGFNPYRINAAGIDWEKPEPENPFGGYGYWGDHQIIYLLRLLKGLQAHFPQKLEEMLRQEIFSYANVPYIIAPYQEILKNSKDTITFDFEKDATIDALTKEMGTDARLILSNGQVYTASLTEKLLVPVLSKMSNLLVGGGIWMNTQRPEWNDANNAIVGIGLSMVTVYHVKAYLEFLKATFASQEKDFAISHEVATWLQETLSALQQFAGNYSGNEKALLDTLGESFSTYRATVYKNGLTGKTTLSVATLIDWLNTAEQAIDYTIEKNKGDVYVTYNLLKEDFSVEPMRSMLEGQSAIIGSGSLQADEVDGLLSSMRKELFNENLRCHMLYSLKLTKRFADKNRLTLAIDPIDGIVVKDENGALHFAYDISTADLLIEKMDAASIDSTLRTTLLAEFEAQFNHKKFNGRSDVFYKFEGIGCVYWHQNAKLALAVLESVRRDKEVNVDNAKALYDSYKQLMSGFTYRKSPAECFAIPIEPYSHSSFYGKSEQPGMTGQVKESVIIRRTELGVLVNDGAIQFDPWFVASEEFDENGKIAFSIYGVPTHYQKADQSAVVVSYNDGSQKTFSNMTIDADTAADIFLRNGKACSIAVLVN